MGGTARAVLKIAYAYYKRSPEARQLTLKELEKLTEVLLKKNRQARQLILNACPDRITPSCRASC